MTLLTIYVVFIHILGAFFCYIGLEDPRDTKMEEAVNIIMSVGWPITYTFTIFAVLFDKIKRKWK